MNAVWLENFPDEMMGESPFDLEGNLKEWCDVFTKVRYIYDFNNGGKGKHMMFFPEIENALLNIIKKRKPEW